MHVHQTPCFQVATNIAGETLDKLEQWLCASMRALEQASVGKINCIHDIFVAANKAAELIVSDDDLV